MGFRATLNFRKFKREMRTGTKHRDREGLLGSDIKHIGIRLPEVNSINAKERNRGKLSG